MEQYLALFQIVWCVLLLLLRVAWTRDRGLLPVILLTAVFCVLPRVIYALATMGAVWMLNGLPWISVMASYLLTVLWMFLLPLLAYGRWRVATGKLAVAMVVTAIVEAVGAANSAVTVIESFMRGGRPYVFAASISLVYAIAQVMFLLSIAKDADPPVRPEWRRL
ncbi:MAG: hypothetical protein ABI811_17545 [Acidobacteriota bacterium]